MLGKVLLLIALLLTGVALSFGWSVYRLMYPGLQPPERSEEKSVEVRVDPRLELIYIVQSLTSWAPKLRWFLNAKEFEYKGRVKARFSRFADHPAIKVAERFRDPFANNRFILHYSPPPELRQVHPFSNLTEALNALKRATSWLEPLRRFAVQTDFMGFFRENQGLYDGWVQAIREGIGDEKPIVDFLESYFGTRMKGYHVLLAPLMKPTTQQGPMVAGEAYFIGSPLGFLDDSPKDGLMEMLVLSEFAHSFVNPITERHKERLRRYAEAAFRDEPEKVTRYYSAYWMIFNEYATWVVVARYFRLRGEEASVNKVIELMRGRGFQHFQAFYDLMEKYEQNRDLYPTFEDFYPEFTMLLKKIAEGGTS